jgi:hypothetical protein
MSSHVLLSVVRSRIARRRLATAVCEGLEIRRLFSLPTGFSEADIGNVGTPGSSTYDASTGTFTVTGGGNYGTDLFSFSDAAHFVYTPLVGNGQITVQMDSTSAPDASTPSGIAIRDSLDPSAAESFLALRPDDKIIENTRASDGAQSTNLFISPGTFPEYLRLVRNGDDVKSYSSTDGVNFTFLADTPLSGLGNTVYVGMVASSSSPQTTATATFSNVSISPVSAALTSAPTVTLPESTPYDFTVTYTSATAVSAESLNGGNLVVTGPDGYSADASVVSTGLTDAATLAVTYSVPALTTAGTYTVSEGSTPVTDTTGNPASAGPIGTFYAIAQAQATDGVINGQVVSALNPTIGIAGRTVFIDANDNGVLDTGEVSAVTDAKGNFSLTGLLPGTYRVEEVLPANITQTDPIIGYDTVTITPTSLTGTASFSEYPASLPSGTSGPDLTATIGGQPSAIVAGSAGKDKVTIKNTGTAVVSGPIELSLLLSPTGTLTAADTVLTTVTIPKSFKLKPGKSKTFTVKFKYPASATGTQHLVAVSDSTDLVTTENQSHKVAFSNGITISAAFKYLAVTFNTQPAATLKIGHGGSVSLNVTNIGNVKSSEKFLLSVYESTDQTLSSDDILLGKVSHSGVPANSAKSYVVHFTVPKTVAPGTDYIVASLTSSLNNNVTSSNAKVTFS